MESSKNYVTFLTWVPPKSVNTPRIVKLPIGETLGRNNIPGVTSVFVDPAQAILEVENGTVYMKALAINPIIFKGDNNEPIMLWSTKNHREMRDETGKISSEFKETRKALNVGDKLFFAYDTDTQKSPTFEVLELPDISDLDTDDLSSLPLHNISKKRERDESEDQRQDQVKQESNTLSANNISRIPPFHTVPHIPLRNIVSYLPPKDFANLRVADKRSANLATRLESLPFHPLTNKELNVCLKDIPTLAKSLLDLIKSIFNNDQRQILGIYPHATEGFLMTIKYPQSIIKESKWERDFYGSWQDVKRDYYGLVDEQGEFDILENGLRSLGINASIQGKSKDSIMFEDLLKNPRNIFDAQQEKAQFSQEELRKKNRDFYYRGHSGRARLPVLYAGWPRQLEEDVKNGSPRVFLAAFNVHSAQSDLLLGCLAHLKKKKNTPPPPSLENSSESEDSYVLYRRYA